MCCEAGAFWWSKLWEVCTQQVGKVFGELEGSVIHFIYAPWKLRISFHHMDITARESLTKAVRKQGKCKKETKANSPKATFLFFFLVLLIWTNIVLCVWIRNVVWGYLVKVFGAQTLLPCDVVAWQWTGAGTMGDRENGLQPTKDRGWRERRVWRGHRSWHTTVTVS